MTAPAPSTLPAEASRLRAPWLQRLRLARRTNAAVPHAAARPRKNLMLLLREWHSRAGLFAFAFLIWLACTGVLLTRSVELGFDTMRIDWPWLMRLYGLHAEPPSSGYRAGDYWLAQTNDYTLINARPLPSAVEAPLGLLVGGSRESPLLFVASPSSLLLVRPDGERIDELTPPILPVSQIRRIGVLKRDPAIIAVQDLDAYQSADEGNSWRAVAPDEVAWSQPEALSAPERATLVDYAKPRIIVEQLLIDLHSGRLFGPLGAWLITIAGVVSLVLAGSGIWMWWRIRSNRRRLAPRT